MVVRSINILRFVSVQLFIFYKFYITIEYTIQIDPINSFTMRQYKPVPYNSINDLLYVLFMYIYDMNKYLPNLWTSDILLITEESEPVNIF